MDENRYETLFQKIVEEQTFADLEVFLEPPVWANLSIQEKGLLAEACILCGEALTAKGDLSGSFYFQRSAELSVDPCGVLLRQGQAWLSRAVEVDQEVPLENAIDAFRRAEALIAQEVAHLHTFQDLPTLYWKWGCCALLQASYSEEADDLYTAISKFQISKDLAEQGRGGLHAAFWSDYGMALLRLGQMLNHKEMIVASLECCQKAVKQGACYAQDWMGVAHSSHVLYKMTGEIEYFEQSKVAYEQALQCIEPEDPLFDRLTLEWIELLFDIGHISGNLQWFDEAMTQITSHGEFQNSGYKFRAELLMLEGLTIIGAFLQDISLLKQVETKLHNLSEEVPSNTRLWCLYGTCLYQMGFYFEEEGYYTQAIQKFDLALSFDRDDPWVWYGKAFATLLLGQSRLDQATMKQAYEAINKAVQTSTQIYAHFWSLWGQIAFILSELEESEPLLSEALGKFEQAIHLRGGLDQSLDVEWLFYYGCALDCLGDYSQDEQHYQEAILVLNKVLVLDPSCMEARLHLGLAYLHYAEMTCQIESFQKAAEHLEQVVKQDYESAVAWGEWGYALLHVAQLMDDVVAQEVRQALIDEAESKLSQAIALGHFHALYDLACLHAVNQKNEQALECLKKAHHYGMLPPSEELLYDTWLQEIRDTQPFKEWFDLIRSAEEPLSKETED